jgi:predicted nucleotidyltransferase component of viral defense system
MYIKTLAPKTKDLLDKFAGQAILDPFYLSGGTALALQLGHRESEDLDFFSADEFDPAKLQIQLEKLVKLSDVTQDQGTLNCFAENVQLQFLHYPYQLLTEPASWNGIALSSVEDIACTKLLTISSRGSKKDFIDLYFILRTHSLEQLFDLLPKKYPQTNYNQIHILKSLVYFDDAEMQGMPRMHNNVSWDEVKNKIINTVKAYKIV